MTQTPPCSGPERREGTPDRGEVVRRPMTKAGRRRGRLLRFSMSGDRETTGATGSPHDPPKTERPSPAYDGATSPPSADDTVDRDVRIAASLVMLGMCVRRLPHVYPGWSPWWEVAGLALTVGVQYGLLLLPCSRRRLWLSLFVAFWVLLDPWPRMPTEVGAVFRARVLLLLACPVAMLLVYRVHIALKPRDLVRWIRWSKTKPQST
jgi:hypothetical protein